MVDITEPVFDAHFHVVDPSFPLIANDGYVPDPFTVTDYCSSVGSLGVSGGAVVSGSFQGFDQQYLVCALEALGPGYVGVTQLPVDVSPGRIRQLDAAGVRAVRFNLYRGGSAPVGELDTLARRVHEVAGWHSELYVDAADLPDLAPTLQALPQVSIDHLGMSDDVTGTLLDLVAGGVVVKATGFGRIHHTDPDALMAHIVNVNPSGLVFGTDLPSTRARTPFQPGDILRVAEAVGGEHASNVLSHNARRLYRL
ncbi:amidohydrolase family protein [Mycobacterium sp.]|uniref:amidohydrolase family protein n=1 Tax=Mycobacterium sp. TaxID=1785 RepID=UPI003D12A03B